MTKILLDTNVFYYWCQLESISNRLNRIKINEYLINKEVYVSEITLLELLHHFKNDIEKIHLANNFIKSKNIKVLKYFDIGGINLDAETSYSAIYLGKVLPLIKIKLEANILLTVLFSITTIFYRYFLFTSQIKNQSSLAKFKNDMINFYSVFKEGDKLHNDVLTFLYEYYENKDAKKLKEKIELTWLTLISKIAEEMRAYNPCNNVLYDNIQNKLNGKIKGSLLRKKELVRDFDKAIKIPDLPINVAIAEYFRVMIREILNTGKKFKKNDILDSQLLKYYPDYQLITNDLDFIKIIRKIDKTYYNNIQAFYKYCKP